MIIETANKSLSAELSPELFIADSTWYKPAGVTHVYITAIGGGGSGAGGDIGGGGYSGEHIIRELVDVSSVDSVTVDVGNGGASVSSGNFGQAGNPSSFGDLITSLGGLRGEDEGNQPTALTVNYKRGGTVGYITGSGVTAGGRGGNGEGEHGGEGGFNFYIGSGNYAAAGGGGGGGLVLLDRFPSILKASLFTTGRSGIGYGAGGGGGGTTVGASTNRPSLAGNIGAVLVEYV